MINSKSKNIYPLRNDLLEAIDWMIETIPCRDLMLLNSFSGCPAIIKERIEVLSKPKKET